MRRARRLLPALLATLLVGVGAAGCTRAVAGMPHAATVSTAVSGSAPAAAALPGTAGTPAPTGDPGAAVAPAGTGTGAADPEPVLLTPDVVADECLLDSAQLTALLGSPVRPPEQAVVHRDDGSRSTSCYAGPAGTAGPMAAVNVYRVRTGTPAQFVRAAGGRALRGAGAAAAVLDTAAGPTLQVATDRFLVTVAVAGSEPDDAAWRAAARAALTRLPA